MRFFSISAGIIATAIINNSVLAANLQPPSAGITVTVEQGDWGAARIPNIKAVLTLAANALTPYFPQHASDRVLVAFSKRGPRVLFEKSKDGAYVVLLNVQDKRWDQFVYQFSHELCHIFTNGEYRKIGRDEVAHDNQWFEEGLCETVSIVALGRVASAWAQSPPYSGWESYAPAFREYAQNLLSERHRKLPSNKSFEEWYDENRETLRDNPYLRKQNELLATQLLPLLESTPGSLQAIGYLNRQRSSSPQSFPAYLASWYDNCPESYRDFIGQVMSLLEGRDRDGPPVVASRVADKSSLP
jgi:hypothetical protein